MDDPGSWCFLVVAICTIGTLFLSTSRLALRHISWVRLEEALKKKQRPKWLNVFRDRQYRWVAATACLGLVVNLIVVLCMVHYFTDRTDDQTHRILPFAWALALSAVILGLFSIAIPQAWARHAGTRLLIHMYPILHILEHICWLPNTLLRWIDPFIRRLAGVTPENQTATLEDKQEELLSVVEEGEKEGVVDEEERDMIASVLEFRETSAGEIMTPRIDVIGIDAECRLKEAVEIIIQQGHSRYPVYEQNIDKVIGLLYAKDLLKELNHPDGSDSIRHRIRQAYYVPESKPLRDLLHEFQDQKAHIAVVLDEYGGTAGIVTIEDILEEIVGEIVDEYEGPQQETVQKIREDTLEIDARCDVDELNEEYALHIPESDDYETLGGFIFARLGYIPKTGDTFEHENLHITILDAGQRKINRARIVIGPHPQETNP